MIQPSNSGPFSSAPVPPVAPTLSNGQSSSFEPSIVTVHLDLLGLALRHHDAGRCEPGSRRRRGLVRLLAEARVELVPAIRVGRVREGQLDLGLVVASSPTGCRGRCFRPTPVVASTLTASAAGATRTSPAPIREIGVVMKPSAVGVRLVLSAPLSRRALIVGGGRVGELVDQQCRRPRDDRSRTGRAAEVRLLGGRAGLGGQPRAGCADVGLGAVVAHRRAAARGADHRVGQGDRVRPGRS